MSKDSTLTGKQILDLLTVRNESEKFYHAEELGYLIQWTTTQAAKVLAMSMDAAIKYPAGYTTVQKRALRLIILSNIIGFPVQSSKELPANVVSCLLDIKTAQDGSAAGSSENFRALIRWSGTIYSRGLGIPSTEALKATLKNALEKEYQTVWEFAHNDVSTALPNMDSTP